MALPQEQLRALDQLRNRLSQLSTQISLLKGDLERNDPLPQWPALQSSASMLGYHLQQVAEVLSAQQQHFTSMNAYPLPNFPGTTQQHVLEQILRKKLEPKAEDWITEAMLPMKDNQAPVKDSLKSDELNELWEWAGPTSNTLVVDLVQSGAFNIDYSLAEIDGGIGNVITGIRRKLRAKLDRGTTNDDGNDDDADGDDDADEEDDDKMDEDKPVVAGLDNTSNLKGLDITKSPIPLNLLLKFASSGELPNPKTSAAP